MLKQFKQISKRTGFVFFFLSCLLYSSPKTNRSPKTRWCLSCQLRNTIVNSGGGYERLDGFQNIEKKKKNRQSKNKRIVLFFFKYTHTQIVYIYKYIYTPHVHTWHVFRLRLSGLFRQLLSQGHTVSR